MSIFDNKKRTKLVENIPIIALTTGLNLIFIFLLKIFPFTLLVSFFIFPLISFFASINTKSKYFLLYLSLNIFLSSVFTGFDFYWIISSLIPSIFIGYFIALTIKNKLDFNYSFILSFLFIIFIELTTNVLNKIFYKQNNLMIIQSLFHITNIENALIILIFVTFLNSIMLFVYFKYFLEKYKVVNKLQNYKFLDISLGIIFSIISITISPYFKTISFLLLLVSAFFTINYFIKNKIKLTKWKIFLVGFLLILSFFLQVLLIEKLTIIPFFSTFNIYLLLANLFAITLHFRKKPCRT